MHNRLMARRWRQWWALRRSEWWPSCCTFLQRDYRKPSHTKWQSVSNSIKLWCKQLWKGFSTACLKTRRVKDLNPCHSWTEGLFMMLSVTLSRSRVEFYLRLTGRQHGSMPVCLSHICTDVKGIVSLSVVYTDTKKTHLLIPHTQWVKERKTRKGPNCCYWSTSPSDFLYLIS